MQDLRLAIRTLVRRPAFSVIAVLTLALGIGANAAVFTVSNAVLLAPLPYADPDEVVILNEQTPQFPILSVTRYNYEDWRDRSRSFESMAAYRPTQMTLTGIDDPERLQVKMITASLLPLLGVTLPNGRNFTAGEDRAGGPGAAILSHQFAQRRFPGENPVGQTIQLDNNTHMVVGVMPPEFELFQPADVFVPFWPWATTLPADRGWHPGIIPIARLKQGVSLDDARQEMAAISGQLEQDYPESNRNVRALVTRAQDQLVQNVRPAILLLTGAVALVLLIACANVANLLLVRAVDRQKEIAVRFALGATRLRILRQLVIESVVLALAGGAAGLLVASWGVAFLTSTTVVGLPRVQSITIDMQVVYFALALAFVTGLVFGILPAIQATQLPIRQALNEEGRGGSSSVRQRKTRSALVVAEVALALVLLVGAGLLLRSFQTLTRVDPGFNPARVLVVNLPLSPKKYTDSALRSATVARIVDRVRTLQGVEGAAMTTMLPMAGSGATIHFNRAAYPPKGPDDYVMAGYRAVTPDYLSTLGVPLRRGRMIGEWDRLGSPLVAIINESMARLYFPDRDALGQRIQLGTEPDPGFPTMEIVGIVGDMKQSFASAPKAEMFVPYSQFPDPILTGMYLNTALVVRTTGDPGDVVPALRGALGEIDPAQPLVNVRTMETAMAGTVAYPRFQMTLLMIFAAVAVTLAAVGVYGVMAYSVTQRTQEIGVRIAVGAAPGQVVSMVVWQGAKLGLVGVAIGLAAGVIAAGGMRSLLFGIDMIDPVTFITAPLILALAALIAAYIPARRAANVSPLTALR